jgi:3-oxoacyl-[acyl-carrier-protein] synthase-3
MSERSGFSAGIVGIGGYLPEEVVTNDMLAARLDTSHEWILARTGIVERRKAADSQATSGLAIEAGLRALRSAGNPEVQALILATTTPDYRCPATAPYVASQLGLGKIPAFDIGAVCSGFIYAMSVATAFVNSNQFDTVLVVAAEKFSTLIDGDDRNTACLFGDGAGAVVVGKVPSGAPGEILATSIKSDGTLENLIKVKGGGSKYPFMPSDAVPMVRSDYFLSMLGQDVFSAAVTSMFSSVNEILSMAGWERDEIDWLIGHQANRRILNVVCKSLDILPDKAPIHLDEAGNTAGASIPLALAAKNHQFKRGDRMVLTAFGAGATWGAMAMTWPEIPAIEFPSARS